MFTPSKYHTLYFLFIEQKLVMLLVVAYGIILSPFIQSEGWVFWLFVIEAIAITIYFSRVLNMEYKHVGDFVYVYCLVSIVTAAWLS